MFLFLVFVFARGFLYFIFKNRQVISHNAANRCWRLARREAQRKPPTAVITATRWRQARSEAERLTPTSATLRRGKLQYIKSTVFFAVL
jgi:hypothetical protein